MILEGLEEMKQSQRRQFATSDCDCPEHRPRTFKPAEIFGAVLAVVWLIVGTWFVVKILLQHG